MYDSEDICLYVGRTNRFLARVKKHVEQKDWWTEVAYTRVFHFETKATLNEVEKQTIKELNPKYNVVRYGAEFRESVEPSRMQRADVDPEPYKCVIIGTQEDEYGNVFCTIVYGPKTEMGTNDLREFLYWVLKQEQELNMSARIGFDGNKDGDSGQLIAILEDAE